MVLLPAQRIQSQGGIPSAGKSSLAGVSLLLLITHEADEEPIEGKLFSCRIWKEKRESVGADVKNGFRYLNLFDGEIGSPTTEAKPCPGLAVVK